VKLRGLGTLGVAQGLAMLAALASTAVYARWLDATLLAGWAFALAAARAALLVLDGGLKTALVRRDAALAPAAESHLRRVLALVATALVAAAALAAWRAWPPLNAAPSPPLVLVSLGAYLLPHAALLPALVRLERAGRFDAVGRAEGAGTLIEFGAPALLLLAGAAALPALAWGVVVGRVVRAAILVQAARGLDSDTPAQGSNAKLWREGLQLQAVALLSMLRDTLHLWLVGPWFGAAWAGAYAFAMMACMVASQALVGLVARVALPALRALPPEARHAHVGRALRLLGLLVLPPLLLLALLPAWGAPGLEARWPGAMGVLPALVLRVLLTLPLALLGPWLLVAAPPRVTLQVHARWTLAETAAATLALATLGAAGLAWVWPLGGVLGLCLYARALHTSGVPLAPLLPWLLRRPRLLRWGHRGA
jgi:O-antigen/teichoic acid export membrane protein